MRTSTPDPGQGHRALLALLPFLVKGALSLSVLREMRSRGFDVTIAYFYAEAVGYTWDACDDFSADGRLLDLSRLNAPAALETLRDTISRRGISLAVQLGAPHAYAQVGRLKEMLPGLRVLDVLYNEVGHTVAHFLHEGAFDGVVVESEAMRAYMARETAKADPSIHVVLSGVDLAQFNPRPAPGAHGFTLGYVGRMSPEKDPLRFVELAEALHARLPALRFAMYGEGHMTDEVKARIGRSAASDAIAFHGYVPHVRDALHALDALVVPSRVDGRPNVVMEANACGLPVFGAPVGGIPELIEDGTNGWLLEADPVPRLAGILGGLMHDPSSLAALRDRCRRVAETRFDRRRMLDDYEALFAGQCAAVAVA